MARTILLFHIISARPSKQPLMVRTFLKVYMELGSYFLFLQEQIKDIIIIIVLTQGATEAQRPAARTARSRLQLSLHAQRTAGFRHKARSAPGQDTRSGQGALARRHTDGPLWAALLKTTFMCKA